MALLNSIKSFIMNVVTSIQESQYRKSMKFTRGYRLDQYIRTKGCQDVSCVEHWVKEFEKQEANRGWL